jgi:hypothetical protein
MLVYAAVIRSAAKSHDGHRLITVKLARPTKKVFIAGITAYST